jgi:hypothetical protein
MNTTATFAQDVGNNTDVAIKTGIDPITIITIIQQLLPIAVNIFKSCQAAVPTSQSPQAVLADHFDEETQAFDEGALGQLRPHTRRIAKQNGQRHLSRDQVDAITSATLSKARDADDATVTAVMNEN